MDLLSGAAFCGAALCGYGLMTAFGLPFGAIVAAMVDSLAISIIVHLLWPAGPLGDKVRPAADLASGFVSAAGVLTPVAYFVGEPEMVATVAVISGGLAAGGYLLLCFAAPLGGQVRLVAGMTAASLTAAAVLTVVVPVSSPHYGAVILLYFFSFCFTLGLVYGTYESCKKVTASADQWVQGLFTCTLLVGGPGFLLWMSPKTTAELRDILRLQTSAGAVCALVLVASFLFFLTSRRTARVARRAAETPPWQGNERLSGSGTSTIFDPRNRECRLFVFPDLQRSLWRRRRRPRRPRPRL
jgi:hypothetical protein